MSTFSASLSVLLLLAPSLSAQEKPPTEPQKETAAADTAWKSISERLRKASNADRVAFEATWHWESGTMGKLRKVPDAGGAVQLVRTRRGREDSPDRASGTCYGDGFRVVLAGPPKVEFVQIGARSLAREGEDSWKASAREDLKKITFLPDPQLLLRGLLEAKPEFRNRSIAELDGEPFEFVSLALSDEAVKRLVKTRALREPDQRVGKFRKIAERQGLDVELNDPPIVDVSLAFDVATKRLVRVHVRALVAQLDTGVALRKLGGLGGPSNRPPEDRSEKEPAAKVEPTEFVRGLPVREAADLLLLELEYVLGEPGAGPERSLTPEQKKLLGS